MGHIHSHLMELYAQDAKETDKPWERWQWRDEEGEWVDFEDDGVRPGWYADTQYRRKPKTININGIEVPEPVRHRLDPKVEFFIPELNVEKLYVRSFWSNHAKDYIWLQRGIIHLTAEAAEIHAKALLSFTEK